MNVPDDLRYSSDHEWARAEGGSVRVGITDFAQDQLGPVVFVQLPTVGASLTKGDTLGEVESTKSVSEIYAPLAGTVVEVNSSLNETPEQMNDDPYGDGWLCVIEASDPEELGALLDADGYRAILPE
jgi:glycine cleavage system H protein